MVRNVTFAVILLAAGWASAQDAQVAAGEKVFVDQKCSICHSIAGKGNQKGALDDIGARLKSEELRMWITDAKGMTAKTKAERKPAMREYKLPKEEVDALVSYLVTLKKK